MQLLKVVFFPCSKLKDFVFFNITQTYVHFYTLNLPFCLWRMQHTSLSLSSSVMSKGSELSQDASSHFMTTLSMSTPHITVAILCSQSISEYFLETSKFSFFQSKLHNCCSIMIDVKLEVCNFKMLSNFWVYKRCCLQAMWGILYESTINTILLNSLDGYCNNLMSIQVSAKVLIMCPNALLN